MAKVIHLIVLISMLALSFQTPSVWAQAPVEETKSSVSGPRKQLATIVFAGLAGAILGLSTLSFYGRPQDKLSNIAVGFAVGVIIGTGYTAYQAATRPKTFYGFEQKLEPEWSSLVPPAHEPPASFTPQLGYSWSF